MQNELFQKLVIYNIHCIFQKQTENIKILFWLLFYGWQLYFKVFKSIYSYLPLC